MLLSPENCGLDEEFLKDVQGNSMTVFGAKFVDLNNSKYIIAAASSGFVEIINRGRNDDKIKAFKVFF